MSPQEIADGTTDRFNVYHPTRNNDINQEMQEIYDRMADLTYLVDTLQDLRDQGRSEAGSTR